MPQPRRSVLLDKLRVTAMGGAQSEILDELRRVILSGDAPPCTAIPLGEVADMFGVSRIPVRESLKTLIGERLVDHRPNLGYTVAQLTPRELSEMYIVREVLETAALATAATLATAPDHDAAIAANALLEEAIANEDPREYHRQSREFHMALARPSKMFRLLHMLESAWNITEPVQVMVHVADSDRVALHNDHQAMLDAFVAGDSAALVAAAEYHHRRLNTVISTLPGDIGLSSTP